MAKSLRNQSENIYPELIDVHVEGDCGENSTAHIVMTEDDVILLAKFIGMSRSSVMAKSYLSDINRLQNAFLLIRDAMREAILHNYLLG